MKEITYLITQYDIEQGNILSGLQHEIANQDPKDSVVRIELSVTLSLDSKEVFDTLVDLTGQIKSIGYDVAVFIRAKDGSLTKSEIDTLVDFEASIEKNDAVLMIDGGIYDYYSLFDLLMADQKIKLFVEELKSHNLSPFENYLRIYDFLTQKVYNQEGMGTHKSRDIISVINGDQIVCVGYAQVMQRLCTELGIRCEVQNSVVYDKQGEFIGWHENNAIYLVDEKYGIDGWYYSDACWDAVRQGKENRREYNHCLIPVSDKDRMKKYDVRILDYDNVAALYSDEGDPSKLFDIRTQIQVRKECDQLAISIFADDKKRIDACDKLIAILKEHDIPADIYQRCKNKIIGEKYSVHSLLGQVMLGNISKVETLVQELKEIPNTEDVEYNLFEDKDKMDIYSSIDSIGAISGQVVLDIESQESERVSPISYGTKRFIADSTGGVSELMQEEAYWAKVEELKANSKPIPLEAFETALRVVYKVEGIPKQSIDKEVEMSIDRTIRGAERRFRDGTNCFSTEALRRRQLEQTNAEADVLQP